MIVISLTSKISCKIETILKANIIYGFRSMIDVKFWLILGKKEMFLRLFKGAKGPTKSCCKGSLMCILSLSRQGIKYVYTFCKGWHWNWGSWCILKDFSSLLLGCSWNNVVFFIQKESKGIFCYWLTEHLLKINWYLCVTK